MYDVVVVGAGPVGCTAARYCAAYGLKTLVLEEHATIGYPVQCAGLLSTAAFTECAVSEKSVYSRVSGASIFGSDLHNPLTFDAGCTKAYVVDRGILDREIAYRAADAGVSFQLKCRVVLANERDHKLYLSDGSEISYRVLIAADGPKSVVARSFGVAPSSFVYAGIQAEIPYTTDISKVSLYPHASSDFFAWMIPVTPGRVRVGLCGLSKIPERFAAFRSQFGGSGTMELVTGTVPIGIRKRICGSSWMLVGDAAGFLKPTSGGGIYTGLRSARHAADTALEAMENGNTLPYEQRCNRDFGRELEIGLHFLKFRRSLNPDDLDKILEILKNPELSALITQYGDMDKPSLLIKQLLHRPEIFRLCPLGIKGIFKVLWSKFTGFDE